MKRGLKHEIFKAREVARMVEESAPMKRGLKLSVPSVRLPR